MIYFLTKSYPPQDGGGGALLKRHCVEIMTKNGLDVEVICLGKENSRLENIRYFKNKRNIKISLLKQRLGILEDYLDPWSEDILSYLKSCVKSNDTIFATCGGELSGIKIGSKIKDISNCKFIAHFHDPLDHTTINLEKLDYKFHKNRNIFLRKYLHNCNNILTSTRTYARHLSFVTNKPVSHAYFGFIGKPIRRGDEAFLQSEGLNIIYGGSDGYAQRSQQIFKLLHNTQSDPDKIHFHVFGKSRMKTNKFHVHHHGLLPRDEYIGSLTYPNMLGYVSLGPTYFRNCIPSKIFDFISMQIPILAILPYGEAFELIREKKIGISIVPGDKHSLKLALEKFRDEKFYRDSMEAQQDCWHEFGQSELETEMIRVLRNHD